DMAFDRTKLRLDEAPGGFRQPAKLGVVDIAQADQPALGREQQANRFLSWRQVEDDAADHTLRVVVGITPPDVRQPANFQGQVEQAVFEILDPAKIRKPAAVSNGNAHSDSILAWKVAVQSPLKIDAL